MLENTRALDWFHTKNIHILSLQVGILNLLANGAADGIAPSMDDDFCGKLCVVVACKFQWYGGIVFELEGNWASFGFSKIEKYGRHNTVDTLPVQEEKKK